SGPRGPPATSLESVRRSGFRARRGRSLPPFRDSAYAYRDGLSQDEAVRAFGHHLRSSWRTRSSRRRSSPRTSGRSPFRTSARRALPHAERGRHPEVLPQRLEDGAEAAVFSTAPPPHKTG